MGEGDSQREAPEAAALDGRMLGLALLWGLASPEDLREAQEAANRAGGGAGAALAWLRDSGRLATGSWEELREEARVLAAEAEGEQPTSRYRALSSGAQPLRPQPSASASQPAAPRRLSGSLGPDILVSGQLPFWGPFERLRLIGEGGMARIFKAFDPRLRRFVALKVLRRDDPELHQRFILEAQAQALVEHEHVCRIFEAGEIEGQVYIAMQLIEGITLKAAVPTMALREKVEMMVQVCEGVHTAHRRGLIHRDLKPANLMVETDEDGRRRAYVLDFGLAREAVAGRGMTATGFVMGTVAYMPPEQARGDLEKMDRRADIWAVGATLYELFTGVPPYGSAEGLEALRRIVTEEPQPPRRRDPKLPADLETIVLKCLEKEPARRYSSARGLGDDLQRWLDGDPILARPASTGERLRRFARRNKAAVAVAGVALVAVLALAGIAVKSRLDAATQARWAQHFGQEAERIEALVRYSRMMPAHNIGPETAQIRGRLARLEAEIAQAGGMAAGPGSFALGRGFLVFGDAARARVELEKAWNRGFRTSEEAYALGRAWTTLFQEEVARTQRIPDAELRAARLGSLETSHKRTALEFLRRGRGVALEPQAFQEGLLAMLDQDFPLALAKARTAAAASPWFYEARRLEAEVHLAEARSQRDAAGIRRSLGAAAVSLAEAQRIAPSDPSLLEMEDRRWQEEIALRWATREDPGPIVARKREVCRRWQALDPGDAEPLGREARALAEAARFKVVAGSSADALLQEAKALASRGLALDGENLEAMAALASCLRSEGKALLSEGADPSAPLRTAIALAYQGLQKDPDFIILNNILSASLIYKWSFDRDHGLLDPAERDRALAHFRQGAAQNPALAAFQAAYASLLVESAEARRLTGEDPEPDVKEGLKALAAARAAGPSNVDHPVIHAYLHLTRAQYRLAAGRDPSADLQTAEEDIEAVRVMGFAPERVAEMKLEIALTRANHSLREGLPARAVIEGGRALLQSMKQANPIQGVQLSGLEAECLRAEGRSPAPAFRAAEAWLAKADATRTEYWLERGRLHHRKFLLTGQAALKRTACADLDRALAMNPRLAEARRLRAAAGS